LAKKKAATFSRNVTRCQSGMLLKREHVEPYIEAQSPAYLEGWLSVLKEDNRAIFSIASYASQAADWLLQKGHGVDETTPTVEQAKVADEIPY
jgi:antirestriction protein ArdC